MKYAAIKQKLQARRAELLGEIAERDETMADITIDEPEDKSFERLEDEVLSALSGADRDEVIRIDAALGKIAEGSYGECEECGQEIAPARLEAMPDALLCINCASAAEKHVAQP